MQPAVTPKKLWTLLAYMAGDNDLAEEMVWGLQQMRETLEIGKTKGGVSISDKVGVVAQFDAQGVNPMVYHLNENLGLTGEGIPDPGEDGRLETANPQESLDRLLDLFEPTPEQIAVARLNQRTRLKQCLEQLESGPEQDCQPLLITVLTKAVELERSEAVDAEQQLRGVADELIRDHRPDFDSNKVEEIVSVIAEAGLGGGSETEKELALRIAHAPGEVVQTLNSQTCERLMSRQMAEVNPYTQLNARNCAIVFCGHSQGVIGDFLPDSDPGGSLSVPALGRILASACADFQCHMDDKTLRIGILGLDSCLMSMAEVCCEVQESVQFLVGSEGLVANTGWPYHRVLEVLASCAAPETAAREIVRKYTAFYRDYELGGASTQIAAIDLGAFKGLLPPLASLVGSIEHLMGDYGRESYWSSRTGGDAERLLDAILLAHWNSQTFKMGQYVDLYDFCSNLSRLLPVEPPFVGIQGHLAAVLALFPEIGGRAVLESYFCGPDFQHAHGLSLYFPWSLEDLQPAYKNLKFDQATGWYSFLEMFLQRTQRPRRGQEEIDRKSGDTRKRPFRHRSDTQAMLEALGLHVPRRMGLAGASRAGIIGDSRSGITGDARSGFTGDARMLAAGKFQSVHFQNPPSGYFRQKLPKNSPAGKPAQEFFGTA